MNLIICGLSEVLAAKRSFIGSSKPKILSIMEIEPPAYVGSGVDHTIILVGDHEHGIHGNNPSEETVKQILSFGNSLNEDDNVIIHCFAGISRSTAAALTILFDRTRDVKWCIKFLIEARAIAAPNRLICDLADKYFGHGPVLFNAATELNAARGYHLLTNMKQT